MLDNNTLKVRINHTEKLILFSDITYSISASKKFYFRSELDGISDNILIDIISKLNTTYIDYTFWWLNAHEAGIKFFENVQIQKLIKLFEKLNLKNKIVFIDNNLGKTNIDNGINKISVPGLIGFTSHMGFEITERKFEKKFICLNRIPKPHRREIFKFLKENYENDSYLSFAPTKTDDLDHCYLDYVPNTAFGNMSHAWPSEFQLKSFCNIVTESMWYSGPIHITEKTDKCFSAGQPFVLVSGPHYLKKLKELGFKTFDKWWDESYDDEVKYPKRISKIKQIIDTIANLSISECESIYLEMIPTLIHNQKLSKSYSNSLYFNFNWKEFDLIKFEPTKSFL